MKDCFDASEDLGMVFGKDWAQGANAEDPAGAVAALEAELETQLNGMHVDESLDLSMDEIEAEHETNFEHEKEGAERRMNITTLMKEINGLSNQQRIRASRIIMKDKYLTDYFYTLAPEDRLELVLDVLDEL